MIPIKRAILKSYSNPMIPIKRAIHTICSHLMNKSFIIILFFLLNLLLVEDVLNMFQLSNHIRVIHPLAIN